MINDERDEQPDWMQRERENELRDKNTLSKDIRTFWVEKSATKPGKFILRMRTRQVGASIHVWSTKFMGVFDSVEEVKTWAEEFCHNQNAEFVWEGSK